jgi:hypothetical protein
VLPAAAQTSDKASAARIGVRVRRMAGPST